MPYIQSPQCQTFFCPSFLCGKILRKAKAKGGFDDLLTRAGLDSHCVQSGDRNMARVYKTGSPRSHALSHCRTTHTNGLSFSFLPLLSAFVSSLGFIVLLQPCLQRFMLGQSCALVSVFSAPRRFFPFINKREGGRPLIVTFVTVC
jgi:hypothetical protein